MKLTNNSKGLTLIEIVVSMAIIGIVIVSFLTIFSTGFVGIVRSGQRADAAYQSQQGMTDKLIQKDSFIDDMPLIYDFSGGPTITIDVSIMEVETLINGNSSKMKSFIPTP